MSRSHESMLPLVHRFQARVSSALPPFVQRMQHLSTKLTAAEINAAVEELNSEMDAIFGVSEPVASARATQNQPRTPNTRSEQGQYASAMHQAQRLVEQQQMWAEERPHGHTENTAAGQHPTGAPATSLPNEATVSPPDGKGAPIVQVFNAPVTLTQHFHISAHDTDSERR